MYKIGLLPGTECTSALERNLRLGGLAANAAFPPHARQEALSLPFLIRSEKWSAPHGPQSLMR